MKVPGRGVVALVALAVVTRLLSLWKLHPLNWDEIEYYRASSWVRQGLVPYRDFWEHHTPLQWFLFAPVTAVAQGPGAGAIITMRVAQIALWLATFALIFRWMRHANISFAARWSALLLALCSSFFMLAAVEFRIDVLGCLLVVAALVFAQSGAMGLAGAALALAGFANIRLGPMLMAALIVFAIARRDRMLRLAGGAVAATSACALYFAFTRSAAVAWQRVIIDNYLADRWTPRQATFLRRLAVPLGWTSNGFDPAAFEPATIVLLAVGMIGVLRVLRRRDSPLFTIAVLQIICIAFVASMKFVFNYHFEIVIVLMLPFVAAELERWRRREVIVALLIVVSIINVAVVVFRGKEDDLRYQDLIMREVDRHTPASGKVFDGVGWALRRQPAYRYWFLRTIVRTLEARGRFEPYRLSDMMRDPPAAVISDYGARVWLGTHHQLRGFVTAHYLPLWRDLWLPGLSARLPPGASASWIVPADGVYRVYASSRLAGHGWFVEPIFTGSYARIGSTIDLQSFRSDAAMSWPTDRMELRRGQRISITSRERRPIGVMIVPASRDVLFRQPPPGVDLDSAVPPRWHVPHLW